MENTERLLLIIIVILITIIIYVSSQEPDIGDITPPDQKIESSVH